MQSKKLSSSDPQQATFYLTFQLTNYLIAFGKPAGHREVAPREFDVHSLGGSPREKQKRKEGEDEEEERKTKTKP